MASQENQHPLYQLQDLRRDFKLNHGVIHILKGLTMEIREKQWLALVGKSGSGKTTLLQLLGGLDRPTGGKVLYRGQDMGKLSNGKLNALRAREFGFIFQSYHLLPELSALENAALPALKWFRNRNEAYARAEELLAGFGLAHRLEHRPAELSGGEQQRVALARALMCRPALILADEPTGNLDALTGAEILNLLFEINEEPLACVMVTHSAEAAHRCDRVLKLENGRLVP
jgi:ABC-type lipoprotein export system ATPase subunit